MAPANGDPPPIRAPEPGPESAPNLTTFEPDRFESLLSLVRSRAAQGEFAAARRHLAVLQREPLVAPQAAAVNAAAKELLGAVHERVSAILRSAAEGAVVRAGRRATAGLEDGSKEFTHELSAAFALADLGRDPSAAPKVPAASWPTPSPIAVERRLRAYRGAEELVGTVVECDDRRVTLRVAAGGRVRFPTVERTASEAVDSTRVEAVEFALAALHAGQPLLARLWLHRARGAGAGAAGTGAASAREQRLAALLR
ncbi:MAG: hypothetical protein NXI31_17150 [bacterium]|nr:hypothetical protein [bacterium]